MTYDMFRQVSPDNAHSYYSGELAKQCAQSTDKAITDALGKLGIAFVDYHALSKRMTCEIDPRDNTETYTLDGEPIIKFWPLEIKTVNEGASVKIVARRKFIT